MVLNSIDTMKVIILILSGIISKTVISCVVDKGRDDENASECSNFITQTQLSGATSGILRCQGTVNAQKIQNCSNDMCVFLIIA